MALNLTYRADLDRPLTSEEADQNISQLAGAADNIDIRKRVTIGVNDTAAQILAKINAVPQYTVSEKQSVWFWAFTQSVPGVYSPSRLLKYKIMNKGKGTYGTGGTQLTAQDLELVYADDETLNDIETDPATDTVNFGALTTETVSEWLNAHVPAIVVQPQDEGYTLFKGTVDGEVVTYLWIGEPGEYGAGELQSDDNDFQVLEDTVPTGIPTLQQVNAGGDGTTDPVAVKDPAGLPKVAHRKDRFSYTDAEGVESDFLMGPGNMESVVRMGDLSFVTPNYFKGQGMTDTEKIQAAHDLHIAENKILVISENEEAGSNVWMLDEAILVKSNAKIWIVNAKLKISNTMRDNIFRSANVGYGITNPQDDIVTNITILGYADAILEGADIPRATGDNGKTLSVTNTVEGNDLSYGTDALNPSENQNGDYRNNGMVFGYVDGLRISGLKMVNMHCWGISLERVKNFTIRDIYYNSPSKRNIDGLTGTFVRTTDGIDVRVGCSNFLIENISGITGDDLVACTVLPGSGTAGNYAMLTTGSAYTSGVDEIHSGTIRNINHCTYANGVRVLNNGGTVIHSLVLDGIFDRSLTTETQYRDRIGSSILFGSNSATYGGATPLGDCRNIKVSNVESSNYRFCIRIDGSISESSFTNITKNNISGEASNAGTNVRALWWNSTSLGARNVMVNNVYSQQDGLIEIFGMKNSGTPANLNKSGTSLFRDTAGNMVFRDLFLKGIEYHADYSANFGSNARSIPDVGWVNAAIAAAVAAAGGSTFYPETNYSQTITWTGTTAPSGTQTAKWRAQKKDKAVQLTVHVINTVAGTAITSVTIPFPSGAPVPSDVTGFTANNSYVYPGVGYMITSLTSGVSNATRAAIQKISSGWQIVIPQTSGNYAGLEVTLDYWTD